MRKEKELINMLRGLIDLLAEESARNQDFAQRLDNLLSELPERKTGKKKPITKPSPVQLPDIHAEWNARGDSDFRLWLKDQPVATLRAIIRAEDFDATRRTTKWKEAEKLSEFITDRLRDRQSRGSAFIGRNRGQTTE
jgi:hypothetical protein